MSEATSADPVVGQTPATPPVPRARFATLTLQTLAAVHALAVFVQPFLAGRFMSGDVSMVGMHAADATLIVLLAIVLLLVALVVRLRGGADWTLVAICAGLLVAEIGQMVLGYTRVLGWHVPLGVALVAGNVLLLIRVFRPTVAGPAR